LSVRRSVLVTDGDQRAALAVTRSLGRCGERVIVCATAARSLAASSRFAAAAIPVASPLTAPEQFADDMVRAAREHDAEFVIPISEASLRAVLPRRSDLSPATIPFADTERFENVSDKSLVLAAAGRHGIAVPRQRVVRDAADATGQGAPLRFPVTVKPARSVTDVGSIRIKSGAVHVADESALSETLKKFPSGVYPLLVQERIVGPGLGVFLLPWNGELRAAFAHRRIREKPPSGGVSVFSESVALDPDLLRRSIELLREFDWNGVAMVEYKLDEQAGTPYLMEINGRFWGSLQLAIDAGVDFPKILIGAARGDPPSPARDYRVGVRLRWEWGDVDNLLLRLGRSRASLSLPETVPGRLTGLLDFARAFGPKTRNEVLRLNDPMPFFHETANWIRGR
jgi:predicted ATP-grasp superfamily ATP-dependent carboligase